MKTGTTTKYTKHTKLHVQFRVFRVFRGCNLSLAKKITSIHYGIGELKLGGELKVAGVSGLAFLRPSFFNF